MSLPEIVLPQTEPETEWVRGRALQKVSPTRSHALLQMTLGAALLEWAGDRGEVGTEWRFRIAPPGEAGRPLVPDIAFVRRERLAGLSGRDLEVPLLAPDVVVEVLSPDDRRDDVDDKLATYLAAGCVLAIVVDPRTRTVELHDANCTLTLKEDDALTHAALPGFTLSLARLFASIAPPASSR
jgi:Uma2 family endonuclease